MGGHPQQHFSTGLDSYSDNLKGKLYAFNKLNEQHYEASIDLSGPSPSEQFAKNDGGGSSLVSRQSGFSQTTRKCQYWNQSLSFMKPKNAVTKCNLSGN